jgi:hypothetical protein
LLKLFLEKRKRQIYWDGGSTKHHARKACLHVFSAMPASCDVISTYSTIDGDGPHAGALSFYSHRLGGLVGRGGIKTLYGLGVFGHVPEARRPEAGCVVTK